MTYPLSLVNILTVIAAAACLWAAVPEAQGKPQKLWRIAVPPFLATLVALVLLAGAVTSFAHDATWTAIRAMRHETVMEYVAKRISA